MSRASAAGAPEPAAPRGWFARAAAVVRRIIGVPDYAAYVAHVRACHPDREPLGEREFIAERLASRYEKPGSRCC
jgi:uncharacterized short protein YbdD (DUF466 family)